MANVLRVATWNCFGSIGTLQGLLLARPRWPERFVSPHLAASLARYDVVCVQENFLPYVRTALEEVAHELHMHLWHDHDRPETFVRSAFGSGLAFLSRLPPRSVTLTPFRTPAHGFDTYACKGFAVAEFEHPSGARFRVVNTHLQSDDPYFRDEPSARVRAEQLDAVLDAVDRSVPTLVAGDLNIEYGGEEYVSGLFVELGRRGMHDHGMGRVLHTADPVTNDMLRVLTPGERAMRLDYVLSAGGETHRWVERAAPRLVLADPLDEEVAPGEGRMFASDHYGLGVTLELRAIVETSGLFPTRRGRRLRERPLVTT